MHEYPRKYFEEGEGTRDVLITAHAHFNAVFISRWVEFSPCLGVCRELFQSIVLIIETTQELISMSSREE